MTLVSKSILLEPLKRASEAREAALNRKLVRASWHLIHDVLAHIGAKEKADMEWYHQRYLDWMKAIDAKGLDGTLAKGSGSWIKANQGMKQVLYDEVTSESVNGRMLCRGGESLVDILRGCITPLEVMMDGNLLYTYYETGLRSARACSQVKKLVEDFAVKHPRPNILEIG
jgi:hypothetical protein